MRRIGACLCDVPGWSSYKQDGSVHTGTRPVILTQNQTQQQQGLQQHYGKTVQLLLPYDTRYNAVATSCGEDTSGQRAG